MMKLAPLAALTLCFGMAVAQAQTTDFDVTTASDVVVLTFDVEHDMIAEPTLLPLLRIYGDGRAQIHVPPYMHGAGEYVRELGRDELLRIVQSMADDGLLAFDAEAMRAERNAVLRNRGVLYHVSDDTHTQIDVRLERLGSKSDVTRTVRWTNIYNDARTFPNMKQIQALAELERELFEIVTRTAAEGAR